MTENQLTLVADKTELLLSFTNHIKSQLFF